MADPVGVGLTAVPAGDGGPGWGRHYPGWREDVVFDSIGLGLGVGALALTAAAIASQPDVVVAPAAPVYVQPAPVVVQQPVYVQQPVVQQPVVQQPVYVQQPVVQQQVIQQPAVQQPVQPAGAGHWVERENRSWVEGTWVPSSDGSRRQTWQPGYWQTQRERVWVND